MNTDMTGFKCFLRIFAFLCFGRKFLSIGRVKVVLNWSKYMKALKRSMNACFFVNKLLKSRT